MNKIRQSPFCYRSLTFSESGMLQNSWRIFIAYFDGRHTALWVSRHNSSDCKMIQYVATIIIRWSHSLNTTWNFMHIWNSPKVDDLLITFIYDWNGNVVVYSAYTDLILVPMCVFRDLLFLPLIPVLDKDCICHAYLYMLLALSLRTMALLLSDTFVCFDWSVAW